MSSIPVSFADIGKSANDLLGKDYPNAIKLDAKTTASNGVVCNIYPPGFAPVDGVVCDKSFSYLI